MIDVAQELEDLLAELVEVQKAVNKLTTASVSGTPIRERIKGIHKHWLPILGALEKANLVEIGQLRVVADHWTRLVKLTDGKNPRSQYKPVLKSIISFNGVVYFAHLHQKFRVANHRWDTPEIRRADFGSTSSKVPRRINPMRGGQLRTRRRRVGLVRCCV
jgi:hypothetical protein